MNPKIVLTILLLLSLKTFAQKKKGKMEYRIPTELDASIAEENYKCVFRNTYSQKQRSQFYPFNKASKVLLISYNDTIAIQNTTPVENKKLDLTKIRETIVLSRAQVDSLTSILYNVGVKSSDYWFQMGDPGRKCYNPRNSIIFLDEKQRAFEYIEICFECHQDRLSSRKIKNWTLCESKFGLLQDYFLWTGIKIGTVRRTD
jgi:hypothetical protein